MNNVIVLTRAYAYWCQVPVSQALFWKEKDRCEWVYWDDKKTVGSANKRHPLPYVIRLTTFTGYKRRNKELSFSKELMYQRDDNNCQYWHKKDGNSYIYKCAPWERTVDHIVPQSQGGKNSFTNCVCACKHCNEIKKKNNRPGQVNMRLIRQPRVPQINSNEYVVRKFEYNENILCHRKYMEYQGKAV
jgi:5-methylcytosine-specific restriction endonuclease McrA